MKTITFFTQSLYVLLLMSLIVGFGMLAFNLALLLFPVATFLLSHILEVVICCAIVGAIILVIISLQADYLLFVRLTEGGEWVRVGMFKRLSDINIWLDDDSNAWVDFRWELSRG